MLKVVCERLMLMDCAMLNFNLCWVQGQIVFRHNRLQSGNHV